MSPRRNVTPPRDQGIDVIRTDQYNLERVTVRIEAVALGLSQQGAGEKLTWGGVEVGVRRQDIKALQKSPRLSTHHQTSPR